MERGDYECWLEYFKIVLTGAASSDRDATNLVQQARLIALKAVKEQGKLCPPVAQPRPLPDPGRGRGET